jgi:hypothetical protein
MRVVFRWKNKQVITGIHMSNPRAFLQLVYISLWIWNFFPFSKKTNFLGHWEFLEHNEPAYNSSWQIKKKKKCKNILLSPWTSKILCDGHVYFYSVTFLNSKLYVRLNFNFQVAQM